MRYVVQIGGRQFLSKEAALEHFRRMLYRYSPGIHITGTDTEELHWLLEKHPTYGQKRGVGVEHFTTETAPFNTRTFWITRIDGTGTDFSFRKCINGLPSPRQRMLEALRREVSGDIIAAKLTWFEANKDAAGKVPCAITGELVTFDEAHADHAPPYTFDILATTFLRARGIVPHENLLTPPADNQFGRCLLNRYLADEWRRYHHQLAHIRITSAAANLAGAQSGRAKPSDRQLILKSFGQ